MKHIRKVTCAALAAFSLSAAQFAAQSQRLYADTSAPIEQRVEDALARLTLQEKSDLCHAAGKFYSAGVPRLGIPGLWMSDGPHGVRAEVNWADWNAAQWTTDSCTAFPALTCLAATWNPELARLYGATIGLEARYRGKNVMLGPGVNICRTPLGGRNFEYMGEDPTLSAAMCVPYIQGLQSQGVAACVKHFCLNNQEVDRWTVDARCSERALREIYLPAFRAAVQRGGAWSLMGSYNRIDGTHGSHNHRTLVEILKDEWHFDGAVVSDWDATHDARQAALGGLDIEMGTSQRKDKGIAYGQLQPSDCYLGDDLIAAVQRGDIPESVVDDKARRVLRLIFRTAMAEPRGFGNLDYAAHAAVGRRIADEGIVLLRNDHNVLPLDTTSAGPRTILVVGDNAVRQLTLGGGSSELKVHHETSVLEGLQNAFGTDRVRFVQGYAAGTTDYGRVHEVPAARTDSLRQEAVEAARTADVIVFVGGLNKNRHQDCEDADRQSYDLPFGQPQLISALAATGRPVVCVILSGNAVAMPWDKSVAASLFAWYGGSAGGSAVADVLTGRVSPSGRLPFSIPVRLEDCGAHSFGESGYPGTDHTVTYHEGLLVGYRWYDTRHIAPRYAFGHGLTYSTFRYARPTATVTTDSVSVTFDLTNTGTVSASEVVQLYVSEDHPAVERPAKELRAFAKIALASRQTQRVTLTVARADLGYYDDKAHTFRTDSGSYTFQIGASATDIRHRVKVRL